MGLALLEIGQVDEAIANFREAIKLCEDFVEAHFNLGNAFYKIGDLDQALVCYKFLFKFETKICRTILAIYSSIWESPW